MTTFASARGRDAAVPKNGALLSNLGVLVLVSMVLGITAGLICQEFGTSLKVLGDIFLRLVETAVAPLVLLTVSVGIVAAGSRVGSADGLCPPFRQHIALHADGRNPSRQNLWRATRVRAGVGHSCCHASDVSERRDGDNIGRSAGCGPCLDFRRLSAFLPSYRAMQCHRQHRHDLGLRKAVGRVCARRLRELVKPHPYDAIVSRYGAVH